MRLLELVAGPSTRPEAVAAIRDFADRALGKTVIDCADTPGFIANRIGALWIGAAIRHAVDLSLTVEEADAVAGRPFGVPSTGIFGLMDLVGIDLAPHVAKSLLLTLPPDDAYRDVYRDEPIVARLIAEGRTGRKAKGGFYSLRRNGADREKVALDLATGEYRPSRKPALDSLDAHGTDLRALAEHPDRGGRYARAVLLDTLGYAAALVPAIAGTVDAVDTAMRLGYAWKWGPFELIDRVGPAWLAGRCGMRDDLSRRCWSAWARAGSTAWRAEGCGHSRRMANIAMWCGPKVSCCWRISNVRTSRSRATLRRACGISATAWPAWSSIPRAIRSIRTSWPCLAAPVPWEPRARSARW